MNNIIYVILRRLRFPVLLVIIVYAISVLGFVLIPGIDDDGQPYRVDFFHAFYFVSFMGTTIGFGELPHPFTPAQRMWALVCIYGTVTAWLYSFGKVLALLQDPVFSRIVRRRRFTQQVKDIQTPFYLICGFGSSGVTLASELALQGINTVVVDIDPEKIESIEISNIIVHVPAFCGDAGDPEILNDAGIKHPYCVGVLATTSNDQVNLSVAIASKLLAPERIVISRSSHADTTENLASFGTDHIIDPYETFAEQLTWALHKPYQFMLQQWLHTPNDDVYEKLALTLRHLGDIRQFNNEEQDNESSREFGLEHWIICGYGRFGQALYRRFDQLGVRCVVIEPNLTVANAPQGSIVGTGVDEASLVQAGVHDATGIIAGSNTDANNLSIIMTAKALNENIVTVARQNHHINKPLFDAANVDIIMHPSELVYFKILLLVQNPLLVKFIALMHRKTDLWGQVLLANIHDICGNGRINCWTLSVDEIHAEGIMKALSRGYDISLGLLAKSTQSIWSRPVSMPLLVKRAQNYILVPGSDYLLQAGDEVLFAGLPGVERRIYRTASSYAVIYYLITGKDYSRSFLGKWLDRRAEKV